MTQFTLLLLLSILLSTSATAAKVKFLLLGDTQYIMNTSYGDSYLNFHTTMERIETDEVTKNAVALLSMGDMIETGRNNDIPTSYTRLKTGLDKLEMPYVTAFGNNDNTTEFNKRFPTHLFSSWSSFVSVHNDYRNCAHQFSAGGLDWLVVSIQFNASEANREWAENLISSNPDKKVILINHEMAAPIKTLARKYPNVVMALCGHTSSDIAQWTGDHGNKIVYIKHNWHNANLDTYLCIVEIDTIAGSMNCRYYSPLDQKFGDDPSSTLWTHNRNPANEEASNQFEHPWVWTGFDFGESDPVKTEIRNNNDQVLIQATPESDQAVLTLLKSPDLKRWQEISSVEPTPSGSSYHYTLPLSATSLFYRVEAIIP